MNDLRNMPTRFTSIQMKLAEIMVGMGLDIVFEKQYGNFTIDILCLDVNKGFEADGPFHSKRRDFKRDTEIRNNYGIPILRIKANLLDGNHDKEVEQMVRDFVG